MLQREDNDFNVCNNVTSSHTIYTYILFIVYCTTYHSMHRILGARAMVKIPVILVKSVCAVPANSMMFM